MFLICPVTAYNANIDCHLISNYINILISRAVWHKIITSAGGNKLPTAFQTITGIWISNHSFWLKFCDNFAKGNLNVDPFMFLDEHRARVLHVLHTFRVPPFTMTFCRSGWTPVRAKSWALKTMGGSSVFSSTASNFSLPHFTFTGRESGSTLRLLTQRRLYHIAAMCDTAIQLQLWAECQIIIESGSWGWVQI